MKKPRLHIYLDADLHKKVRQRAKQLNVPLSHIGHAAIASFVTADEDKREATILRRLDRMTRQHGKLERDLTVISEALALFIQYQLAITPPIPVSDQAGAKAKGRERFEQFTSRLARRLAEGKSIVQDVIDEISPREEDFFEMDLEPANDK